MEEKEKMEVCEALRAYVRRFPSQRKAADSLETQVAKKVWPLPTYADMLFYV